MANERLEPEDEDDEGAIAFVPIARPMTSDREEAVEELAVTTGMATAEQCHAALIVSRLTRTPLSEVLAQNHVMEEDAARALDEGIVDSPDDGDLALVLGIGWPPFRGGLLRWADDLGLGRIVGRLDEWAVAVDPRFAPSPALRERARWRGGFYGRPPEPSQEVQPSLGEGF